MTNTHLHRDEKKILNVLKLYIRCYQVSFATLQGNSGISVLIKWDLHCSKQRKCMKKRRRRKSKRNNNHKCFCFISFPIDYAFMHVFLFQVNFILFLYCTDQTINSKLRFMYLIFKNKKKKKEKK